MEKQEQSVPMLIKLVIGVVLFGITVWGISWAASSSNSAHAGLVGSHEKRLLDVEGEVKSLDKRLDNTEKMQISLAKDQSAILTGQQEMKAQQSKFKDMMIEKIKSDAEIKAWIKSIDKVD